MLPDLLLPEAQQALVIGRVVRAQHGLTDHAADQAHRRVHHGAGMVRVGAGAGRERGPDRVEPGMEFLDRRDQVCAESRVVTGLWQIFHRHVEQSVVHHPPGIVDDLVAGASPRHAYALAVERLVGVTVPRRGQLIRVLYSEIGRILSHLLNVTTQAMDVGALTPPLWGFEEREKLMIFYERACGARMHAAYVRPGGVHQDIPVSLIHDIAEWCDPFLKVCDDLEDLLTDNRIFKQRNVDIGVVKLSDAWAWGFSGVMGQGVLSLQRNGCRNRAG